MRETKQKERATSHVRPRCQGVHCRVPLRHCKLAYSDLINNALLSACTTLEKRGVTRARLTLSKQRHTLFSHTFIYTHTHMHTHTYART